MITPDDENRILTGQKPWWQIKHDWWLSDFEFEMKQLKEFKLLLRKHPDKDDKIRSVFIDLITIVRNRLAKLKRDYEKVYYDKPMLKKP